jgi:hypothetical protein
MSKKKMALIVAMVLLPILASACAVLVIDDKPYGHRHRHPRYCYNCHYQPTWSVDVVDCDHYAFYFDVKGYWYAPRHGNEVWVFKKFNYKKDKDFKVHYEKRWLSDEKRITIEKTVKVKEKPDKAPKRREK